MRTSTFQIRANAIRDERIREYLPVESVLYHTGIENPDYWIGNTEIQPVATSNKGLQISPGGSILVDFGIELHGGVRVINGKPRGLVRITFGESASEAMETPSQDHAIHQAELELPCMGMLEYGGTAFRFVRLDNLGNQGLSLRNLLAVGLYRDDPVLGCFHSSDDRLNRIWQTALHTLRLNMQDYIYDGAKRDRLIWMGDLHPEIRGILAAFGDLPLINKTLHFLRENTPPDQPMNRIPSYDCWYIITLADLYQYNGDIASLCPLKDDIACLLKRYSAYLADDGSERTPEFRFLDWPSSDNLAAKHAGLQALMFWMFRSGVYLLKALEMDSQFAEETLRKLEQHLPDCGLNKTAAALMTVSGLANRQEILAENPFRGISTFQGFYILQAQKTLPALQLIRTYWGAMLDRGATSFWEDFDLDWLEGSGRIDELAKPGQLDLHRDFGAFCYKGFRHSLCHGWACGPLPFLSERISGIRFLEPGGRQIALAPDAGDLEYVECIYPAPRGNIQLILEKGKKACISLPEGIILDEQASSL